MILTTIRRSLMLTLGMSLASAANAATLPNGFNEVAITGANLISDGTSMTFSPDGKLFVLERAGTVEVFEGSGPNAWTRRQANFFANTPLNANTAFERGLLGLAFDPDYANNRFVYVYYTVNTMPVHNRIERYTANVDGDLALAASATTLMDLDPLAGTFHHGGAMHFGPGGHLFVATGDDDDAPNAQLLTNRFGKILRLTTNPANPIPANNPASIDGIAGTTAGDNRAIWAAGLRNPFTFCFKPGTNLMYINDVGEADFEEVNVGKAGANYGWPTTEGPFNRNNFPGLKRPLFYYHHNSGLLSNPPSLGFTGQSIIGGAFYVTPNPTFPVGYQNDYYFADYIVGWIRRYDTTTKKVKPFIFDIAGPVAIRVGNDGALYYLARNAAGSGQGRVFRVQRGNG